MNYWYPKPFPHDTECIWCNQDGLFHKMDEQGAFPCPGQAHTSLALTVCPKCKNLSFRPLHELEVYFCKLCGKEQSYDKLEEST